MYPSILKAARKYSYARLLHPHGSPGSLLLVWLWLRGRCGDRGRSGGRGGCWSFRDRLFRSWDWFFGGRSFDDEFVIQAEFSVG